MALRAGERREVIEDLLDINIFTKMKNLLKEKQTRTNEKIKDLSHQIEIVNTKIAAQKKYICNIELMNADQVESKEKEISQYREEIQKLILESSIIGKDLNEILDEQSNILSHKSSEMSEMKALDLEFNRKAKRLVDRSKFYEENNQCPSCDQHITQEQKDIKISKIVKDAKQINAAKIGLSSEKEKLAKTIDDINLNIEKLKDKQSTIMSNNQKVSMLNANIEKEQNEINKLSEQSSDLSSARDQYSLFIEDKEVISENKLKLLEERVYNDAIGEMLKDTGIKTKVIKQYLPVMNNLINKYLQVLDFFVAFNLDEAFNETIKSRHRDTFNYSSFSEGEKQRIDLALLFTWRTIAQMKNSAATNLLILDETFDSSLDVDGIENLTKILGTLEDGSNVFIISHKSDQLENKFRSKIEFVKANNFSKIKE